MFVDRTPSVALVCAARADREGNLYTGANTEDTPAIVEAAAFRHGVVVAQADEIVDRVPRVDIPADWVDFVVEADRPFALQPLFTRDPRQIGDVHVLKAMLAIRGVYERHGVQSLNHGVGYDTAAIELILPTYGERLGLRGKVCRHWTLNPHPNLIPAIESGWVQSVHCSAASLGWSEYVRAPPTYSSRAGRQPALQPGLQPARRALRDRHVHRVIAADRWRRQLLDGHCGPARGLRRGAQPRARPTRAPPPDAGLAEPDRDRRGDSARSQARRSDGRDFSAGRRADVVESWMPWSLGRGPDAACAVMIYGDDVSHVVTEEGVAYLYKEKNLDERRAPLRRRRSDPCRPPPRRTTHQELRSKGLLAFPGDCT